MPDQKLTLSAEPRKIFGRKVKKLRRQGIMPANIFGKNIKSQSVQILSSDFNAIFKKAGETNIIYLTLKNDSTSKPILITNFQLDPVTDEPLHADLHQVDLKVKVTATIPLETVGESLAVKEKNGVLVLATTELEVEALPTDLPDKIEVDISSLEEIGSSILAKDLKIDKSKVKLNLDEDSTIVIIQEQKEEQEAPAPEEPSSEEDSEDSPKQTKDDASDSKDSKKEDKKESPDSSSKEESKSEKGSKK